VQVSSTSRLRLAIFVAAFSGFIALSYELVWYRVLYVMTRGIAATFGLLLAAYLLGLAIGARASAVFCKDTGGDARSLRVLAVFVSIANGVAALVGPTFAWSARFTDFRLGLVVVAIGAAFLGAILPLVTHYGIDPDDRAGQRVSYVYLANIVGSAAGSLLTGFVLMDRLSLVSIARVLLVAGFALAAMLAIRGSRGRASLTWLSALGACALLGVLVTPRLYDRLYERLVWKREFNGTQKFAMVVENKSGVISVDQDGTVYGSGIYDGVVNTSLAENDKNWIMRAYVVGALHPAPREVLMVGLSSGSWAQVIANLPGVEHLTAIEINPGYLEVIAAYPDVASVLRNPKVAIEIDDGRRWLLRHDKRFDVIVMNTTLHWRGHATNLLSTEFLELARRHLRPGGILYFNTTDSHDVQLTAARAFPYLWRITNHVAVSDSEFQFDRPRWHKLLQTMTIDGKPILDLEHDKALYEECAGFIQIEPRWSMLDRVKTAHVVTDDNMVVEWERPLRYDQPEP
jgi:spermidine synthase